MADRYQKRRQTHGATMRLSLGSPSATTPTLLSWFSAACAHEWVCIVVIFLIVVFVVNTFICLIRIISPWWQETKQ